jgi:hypothetical protein
MRKLPISMPVRKPHNLGVKALIARLRSGSGRLSLVRAKRACDTDDNDLAQRVRDVGEW